MPINIFKQKQQRRPLFFSAIVKPAVLVFSMDDRSMRCVEKDLGLSAQNRHEIGRILQEDGKLHLFILHIFINLLKYYVRSV